MFAVVGLGNPGERYKGTRHNVGFRVVEKVAENQHTDIRRPAYRGLTAIVKIRRTEVLLMEPQTYMNLSGESVRHACRDLAIDPERVVVVYDDVDLPVGRVRIRAGGGAGGHRGVRSIMEETGEAGFVRLRVGVGRPPEGIETAEHVLRPFDADEEAVVEAAVLLAAEAVEDIVCDGVLSAMNKFNGMTAVAVESDGTSSAPSVRNEDQ